MIEIFTDINDEIKSKCNIIWKIALAQDNPIKAAKFLNNVTEYYRQRWSDEEINFLQFYLYTQMEMMKND
jgi:hypothetical protein